MTHYRMEGLIAATYTPMSPDGAINLDQIEPMVAHLVRQRVDGLYVCGSTGEGVSLTGEERRQVAEAYVVSAKKSHLPVVVQVGHNSLHEARDLARHAAEVGADCISANAPSYFKVTDAETLVECMEVIAGGAPDLPFYYYHIPVLTGTNVDVCRFLEVATDRIPNLVGVKYTAQTVHEYQACLEWRNGCHDILWGTDEMLLSALAVGARGAVGSTYNIAAPLYRRIIEAFDQGKVCDARELTSNAIQMVRTIYQYPFHSAMKAVLAMQGVECGACRLPQKCLEASQVEHLQAQLQEIGFFEWSALGTN